MPTLETDTIKLEESEDVLTVRLNRPDKLNAVNEEMADGLHDLWTALRDNPEKAVLFTGAGQTLCAGADTEVVGADDFSASEGDFEIKQQEVFQLMDDYPYPTVTACQGAAVGAGFLFAMETDFAILGDETTFSYPETKMGLFSDMPPKLLSHLHGAQVAREVILKSEPLDPERAKDLGLVTEVVPEDSVESAARELVEKLAEYDETVVDMLKQELAFEYDPDDHVGYP